MVTLISSVDLNFGIGFQNKLLIESRTDLKIFKEFTSNKIVVMGYNTFLSIGKPLKNRVNVILTSKRILIDDCFVYNDIKSILTDFEDIIVIGGSSLFNQFINIADEIILTKINKKFTNVDSFFPEFNELLYDKHTLNSFTENNINYDIIKYTLK